jgi:signal peptidase I
MDEEIKKEVIEEVEETKEKPKKKPWYKRPKIVVMLIAIAILLIFNINYTFVVVVGPSMEPNYSDCNIVLSECNYDYIQRFDVVGLPGETVEYKDNKLYINGELTEDRYNYGGTNDFKVTLDTNSYFCLGDNRTNSADSRTYGDFDSDEIFAKVKGRQHVGMGDIKDVLSK